MTDVVDLIERDHRGLEEQLAKRTATHDVVVARRLCSNRRSPRCRERVHPVVASELPNGKLLAGDGDDDHVELWSIVGRLREETGSDRLPGLVDELGAALELHVDTEEIEVLPQVRAVLEPDEFVALGRAFADARWSLQPPRVHG